MSQNLNGFETTESQYTPPEVVTGGEIRNYGLTRTLFYPRLVLYTDTGIPQYRIATLLGALDKLDVMPDRMLTDNRYYVYLETPEGSLCLGILSGDRLRFVLKSATYKEFRKTLELSETSKVEGDMIFSFCTGSIL